MWHFWFLWWLACSCGTATSCATSCTSIIFGLYCRRSQPKQRRDESLWQKLGDLGIRKPFRSKRGGRNHSFNCIPAITTIGAPLFLSDQEIMPIQCCKDSCFNPFNSCLYYLVFGPKIDKLECVVKQNNVE